TLPRPMAIGSVELADGAQVPVFLCEPAGLENAKDITPYGGWRSYLAAGDQPVPMHPHPHGNRP
ncbi:allophanate hydrolase, partial [Streptomyces sp. MCAF7]